MGLRFRKSINLGGGFRINLSKSGIGYSWGVKGFRRTRTATGRTRRTYSIPGTGISYVDESGRGSRKGTKNSNSSSDEHSLLQNIESADIQQFKIAETAHITDAIEKTLRWNHWSNMLLWCTVLAAVQIGFIVLPILGLLLKTIAHKTGVVELEYSLDDEKTDQHKKRIEALKVLTDCEKIWQEC